MLDDPPVELGELVRLKGGVEGNDPGRTFVDCKGIVFVLVLDVLSVECSTVDLMNAVGRGDCTPDCCYSRGTEVRSARLESDAC